MDKAQWKDGLCYAVKFAWQKLSKSHPEVTPPTGMHLISTHFLHPFRKLQSFRKWDKEMDLHPVDETPSTTWYEEAFLSYVENAYCAKYWCLRSIEPYSIQSNNLFLSTMASGSGHSSFDQYDLTSDDEQYLMPDNVAEMTPRQCDYAAH